MVVSGAHPLQLAAGRNALEGIAAVKDKGQPAIFEDLDPVDETGDPGEERVVALAERLWVLSPM